ncbi:MAG: type I restriction enzyme HsdR N-terminal domain-containing protein [Planctomycetales bacterium]|nr:type I restriction enzyme HsdR N-terminal domain-containing protein [Planctomycetales bacterium]
MPLINALGYNVFDPTVVVPEFTADVGTKKGEKVDYAILRDGAPILLWECKRLGVNLDDAHCSQLFRYFTTTSARIGILTNGVDYRFFSDLDEPNKMDTRPFFEFSLRHFDDLSVSEIARFGSDAYDLEAILTLARELKYSKGIQRALAEEWLNPSEDLVRLLTARVYSGRMTQAVREQFTQITQQAMREFVAERVRSRLRTALASEGAPTMIESEAELEHDEPQELAETEPRITTTNDEIEAYFLVKSIVRQAVAHERVFMRDTQSYCGILLDDNNRKPICRLFFDSTQKYLGTVGEGKTVTRHPIATLNDIYQFSDELIASCKMYDGVTDASQPDP